MNSINILFELRKDRALSLSFANNLLTEIQGNEIIIGAGYRVKDLRIATNFGGKKQILKSDLNFKLDSCTNLGEVCSAMKSINQSILQDVSPVDIYQSKKEDNKKNVLFKLSFQSVKKTLEDNEVNAVIAEIINVVTKKFNAKLRDN